jgi:hypothetical protein
MLQVQISDINLFASYSHNFLQDHCDRRNTVYYKEKDYFPCYTSLKLRNKERIQKNVQHLPGVFCTVQYSGWQILLLDLRMW